CSRLKRSEKNIELESLRLEELLLGGIGLGTGLICLFKRADHLVVVFLGQLCEPCYLIVVSGCLISQGLSLVKQLLHVLALLKLLFSSFILRTQGRDLIHQWLLFFRAQNLGLLSKFQVVYLPAQVS